MSLMNDVLNYPPENTTSNIHTQDIYKPKEQRPWSLFEQRIWEKINVLSYSGHWDESTWQAASSVSLSKQQLYYMVKSQIA